MKADVIEAETFFYKYPDVEAIDLLIPDSNGILRGKRVKRDALSKAYRQGITLPGSIFATTITGDTAEETGLGFDQGDADRICWPVDNTIVIAPWQSRSMAQVLMTMYETDGTPFFADPRHVLNNVLEKFSELDLTPVTAIELEFYLLDKQRDSNGLPQAPISPMTGLRDSHTQVYGMNEIDAYAEVLDAIVLNAELQDLPADTAVAEYAPAQFEVNLKHSPDPIAACDQAIMLKRLVKAVARKHDMEATFMAKPYVDRSGNGLHVHINLQDELGNNIFQQENNPQFRYALGGMLATMPEAMALLSPSVNSYRRLQPDSYMPLSAIWGYNNRTVALRIPSGPDSSRRIEHRAAGADANPYLVMAALLAGMHYGISEKIEPPDAVTGNAYEQFAPNLPASWWHGIEVFREAKILPDYLGEDFCRVYAQVKQAEREMFNRQITALEYEWFLNT